MPYEPPRPAAPVGGVGIVTGPGVDTPTVTAPAPEVLRLPPRWVAEHYAPTEAATWDLVRDKFATDTHLPALAEDLAAYGVQRPLELHPDHHKVLRGHHRLLVALDEDLAYVPVVFAFLQETTEWDPRTRSDVPYDAEDWEDEDPWVDEVFEVPAAARVAALTRQPVTTTAGSSRGPHRVAWGPRSVQLTARRSTVG